MLRHIGPSKSGIPHDAHAIVGTANPFRLIETPMLRMTRQADYGIVLLRFLAQHHDEDVSWNAKDLAGEVHLPLPMVSKILKLLARANLLTSTRGVKGGYRLVRSPEAITVTEVIEALEGPIAITDCTSAEDINCDIAAMCAVRSNWTTINRVVRAALDEISLSQMAAPMRRALATATPRTQE